jgi:hypothetical protein
VAAVPVGRAVIQVTAPVVAVVAPVAVVPVGAPMLQVEPGDSFRLEVIVLGVIRVEAAPWGMGGTHIIIQTAAPPPRLQTLLLMAEHTVGVGSMLILLAQIPRVTMLILFPQHTVVTAQSNGPRGTNFPFPPAIRFRVEGVMVSMAATQVSSS